MKRNYTPGKNKKNMYNTQNNQNLSPLVFVSHCLPPLLLDPKQEVNYKLSELGEFLSIFDFRCIVVISSQYIKKEINITSRQEYQGMHDHPFEEFHNIQFKAKGSPEIAQEIQQLFQNNQIESVLDEQSDLDHTCWMPLSIMFPEQKFPVLQISIDAFFDEDKINKTIKVLQELRKKNCLILCSGNLTNNQKFVFQSFNPILQEKIEKKDQANLGHFYKCMDKICTQFDGKDRSQKIKNYDKIPDFDTAHPYKNQFIPLYIALQTANNCKAKPVHQEFYKGTIAMNCYIFDQ